MLRELDLSELLVQEQQVLLDQLAMLDYQVLQALKDLPEQLAQSVSRVLAD